MSAKKLVAVALLAVGGTAHAQLTIFSDETAFKAALASVGTDTFNDLTPGPRLGWELNRPAGSFRYRVMQLATNSELSVAGGTADSWLASKENDGILLFELPSYTYAAGGYFFALDSDGNFGTQAEIQIGTTNNQGGFDEFVRIINPSPSTFVGFISYDGYKPLVSIMANSDHPHRITVNDFSIGTVANVPEPKTWLLALIGLAMLGFARERRFATCALRYSNLPTTIRPGRTPVPM